jgi:hypothetical protein
MNTMVGLEASLHTYVGEETEELMKSDNKTIAAFAAESEEDMGEEDDHFALGDFDPEELLKAPMLNNSINGFNHSISENSFGTYDVGDLDSKPSSGSNAQGSPGSLSSQLRSYDVVKQRTGSQHQQLYSPSLMQTSNAESSSVSIARLHPTQEQSGDDFNVPYSSQLPASPPRRLESIRHSRMPSETMAPNQHHERQVSYQEQGVQFHTQLPHQNGNYSRVTTVKNPPMPSDSRAPSQHNEQAVSYQEQGAQFQTQLHQQNGTYNGTLNVDHESNVTPYEKQIHGMLMKPHPSSIYGSPTQVPNYLQPTQVNSFSGPTAAAPQFSTPYAQGVQSSNSSYSSPSRERSAYGSLGHQGSMSQLQRMQQFVSQFPPSGIHSSNSSSLSQTVHGEPYRTPSASAIVNQGMSMSMHGDSCLSNSLRSSSFHGSNQFMSATGFSNVSIATNMQVIKSYQSDRSLDMSSHSQTVPGAPLSEAMEKLCESMKRSAMSRSMIKQYSGRGPMLKQGSSRGLIRQNSSRGGMIDDASGRGTPTGMVPIRRVSMNAKHQLQHPVRGVYRHDSQQSLNHSNHNINLHVDGRSMGTL